MGWDADASYEGEPFRYVRSDTDPLAANAFKDASESALRSAGAVDGYLEKGGLDMTRAVRALANAANETDPGAVWSPQRTKELHAAIQWPEMEELPADDRWPVASAKAFLRACAENGYGIQFDP